MSHSVRSHLRIEIGAYDAVIRQFIPGYEEMLARVAGAVGSIGPGHVIDLGAGTGALSEAVLERCPDARVTLIDADPEMLEQARERLAPYAARARFLEASFYDPLPECDAVIASLALHHVPDMARKRALYGAVEAALRPGGLFANADVTMPADSAARDADYRVWADHLVACGIPEERAWRHFEEWADEDVYMPLEEELAALADAGLAAECLWRLTPATVMTGAKAVG